MRDVSIGTTRMDGGFARAEAASCFMLACKAARPERRAYFLRLAWHWRAIARVLAGREPPADAAVAAGEIRSPGLAPHGP